MAYSRVLLLGGSGFLGSVLAEHLFRQGCRVRIATRRRSRTMNSSLLPTAELVEGNIHDPADLRRLLRDQDAVVNLVGVLHGGQGRPYGPGFARAHVQLPTLLAQACVDTGVRRLLHVSALHADERGPSQYLRSKGAGQAALLARRDELAVTIFQPSVVFGPGDSFLNLFAQLLTRLPVLALGGAHARFQPVYVGDVAQAMVRSLNDARSFGQCYPLVGPQVYRLDELVQLTGQALGITRPIIPLPDSAARLLASLMALLPNPPMTTDNLDSMTVDSVAPLCPLPFGLTATPLEAILPLYIRPAHPWDRFRAKARR